MGTCDNYDLLITTSGVHDLSAQNPGDVVAVQSGVYNQLAFRNAASAPGDPITICNHGGQVRMTGDWDVSMSNCRHVHFTGTGTAGVEYGFYFQRRVLAYRTNTDLEFDHIEWDGAGIRVTEDPDGDPNWETSDIHIHDCYLHDNLAEAIYLGRTPYSPGNYASRRFTVRDNILTNNREGISVISCIEDCLIHDNYVYDTNPNGPATSTYAAIIIDLGTAAKIYRNIVIDCEGVGIELNDGFFPGDEVYGNLVVDCGKSLPGGHQSAILTWYDNGRIYNNTIIGAAEYGVYMPDGTSAVEVFNNVILGTTMDSIRPVCAPGNCRNNDTKEEGYTPGNYGFVDEANGDYHLMPHCDGVDAGEDAGLPYRGAAPDLGAFEYEAQLLRADLKGSHRGILRGVTRGVI